MARSSLNESNRIELPFIQSYLSAYVPYVHIVEANAAEKRWPHFLQSKNLKGVRWLDRYNEALVSINGPFAIFVDPAHKQ